MGRPRKAKPGEGITLGFRAEDELVRALDDAAKVITPGVTLSRTQAVKVLLKEALERRGIKLGSK